MNSPITLLPNATYHHLLKKITEKKELRGIHRSIVLKEISTVLRQHPSLTKKLTSANERSASFQQCKKLVRARLRTATGMFQAFTNKQTINQQHLSLKERAQDNKEIYKKIFSITGKPASVLDLGCGLNPLTFPLKNVIYYAADINEQYLTLVKQYFNKKHIQGKTFIYDLHAIKNNLPIADMCLLFKVLDVVEKKSHKLAERIVLAIPVKYIIISFSTKTLSGKPMNHPERGWIEQMLNRISMPWKKFRTTNEIFYVVQKRC